MCHLIFMMRLFEPFINQSRKESIVHDKKLRKIEKAEQRKNKSA